MVTHCWQDLRSVGYCCLNIPSYLLAAAVLALGSYSHAPVNRNDFYTWSVRVGSYCLMLCPASTQRQFPPGVASHWLPASSATLAAPTRLVGHPAGRAGDASSCSSTRGHGTQGLHVTSEAVMVAGGAPNLDKL